MSIKSKLRFEVFKRDDFTCQYCGRKTPAVILEVDHIHPRCDGGTDEFENLTTSCFECNRGKGKDALDHVLQNKDVHEQTIILAERELQIAEYNAIRMKQRNREDKEIKQLQDHLREVCNCEYGNPAYLRIALRHISYIDIWELIDYTAGVIRRDRRGLSWKEATSKFLGACLRNKIAEAEGKM